MLRLKTSKENFCILICIKRSDPCDTFTQPLVDRDRRHDKTQGRMIVWLLSYCASPVKCGWTTIEVPSPSRVCPLRMYPWVVPLRVSQPVHYFALPKRGTVWATFVFLTRHCLFVCLFQIDLYVYHKKLDEYFLGDTILKNICFEVVRFTTLFVLVIIKETW